MRQISLDSKAEALATEYARKFCNNEDGKKSLYDKAKESLTKLRNSINSHSSFKFNIGTDKNPIYKDVSKLICLDYIDNIIKLHTELLTVHPSGPEGFAKYISIFHNLIDTDYINRPFYADGNYFGNLAKMIVDEMKYKEMRNEVYPSVIRSLGIKTCVYCNANYAINDSMGNGYYDLDHWKPKSKYPYLCTSFFNLQPSCPSCNRKKNDDTKLDFFHLWDDTGKKDLDILKIDITHESIADYLLNHDTDKLEPILKETSPMYSKICEDTNSRMMINQRYKEHVDVAEEVIWKSQSYNAPYLTSLRETMLDENGVSVLQLSEDELTRFILGTYGNAEEVYKRPLTSMIQGLGKQLGIIN